jgi:hypothetical protein
MLPWLLGGSWMLRGAESTTVRAGVPGAEGTRVSVSAPGAANAEGALARARRLAAELPDRNDTALRGGESEMHEWWLRHAEVLREARVELGPLHPALYDLEAYAHRFLHPALVRAVERCEAAAASGAPVPEEALYSILSPAGAPGVWRLSLFTQEFSTLLLEELAHYERSGIPLRRPNGMVREPLARAPDDPAMN